MSDEIILNTEQLAQVKPTAVKVNIPTFDLVRENDSILFRPCVEWDFSNPPTDANAFASSLVETCIKNRGLGLSANQCGFAYRVFVAGYGDDYVAYFNPKILSVSADEEIGPEGCLSFPHLFLNIIRPKSVTLEYQDFTGQKHVAQFDGLTARVVLHEYDHMDGKVFQQRAKPLALKTGLNKRDKLFHKLEKAQKQLTKMAKQGRR